MNDMSEQISAVLAKQKGARGNTIVSNSKSMFTAAPAPGQQQQQQKNKKQQQGGGGGGGGGRNPRPRSNASNVRVNR